MGELLSLLDPATIANPYPLYHRLREEDPVDWDDKLGLRLGSVTHAFNANHPKMIPVRIE